MGVALYVQGYEKKHECLTGQIQILGWYEVNKDQIEEFKIADSFTVLHSEIESIKIVESEFYNYGFEDPGELSFYKNLMNGMTGGGFRNEDGISYGLMFDGERILNIINKILSNFDHITLENNSKEVEENNLKELKKVLTVIAENNGIVGMMWG